MVRFPTQKPTPEDTAASYAKILQLQDSLTRGADFDGLAQRNSEDPGSAPRGGDLGWFSRRRWVQPFDEAAFTLKAGEVSRIIRTSYGYHIIKCLETRAVKSFEDSKQELTQLYQQVRHQDEYARYLADLKREVGYSRNDSVMTALFLSLDSTRTTRDSAWAATIPPALGRSTLVTIGGSSVSVDSVITLIKLRQDLSNIPLLSAQLRTALDRVTENLIFSAKADLLEKRNPEFAGLLHEYREAILLYQVEQDNVWSRVEASDSVLRAHFESNRDRFTWPDRVRFSEIRSGNEINARILNTMLREGRSLEEVAAIDSARMQRPTRFELAFVRASTNLRKGALRALDTVLTELRADTLLRVLVTARPDTTKQAGQAMALAARRLDAIRKRLVEEHGVISGRVTTTTQAQYGTAKGNPEVTQIEILGRQPRVVGKITLHLLPLESDERALKADSLAVGKVTSPFFYKGGYSVVRLDGREAARRKTYDEAAPEVATAFQDYESKRLEARWLDRLRTKFPVTVHRDQLARVFSTDR
jgi:hypothetical protein